MTVKLAIAAAAVASLLVIYFAMLGYWSQKPPPLGLVAGKLRGCPASPNCVCSEQNASKPGSHTIPPIALTEASPDLAWASLKQAISANGGALTMSSDHYLHATFTSRLFHFVDDVEARLDANHQVIHLRSASRVGRSDFGVNRKRIEAIRENYLAIMEQRRR